jgi:hypothetical protein
VGDETGSPAPPRPRQGRAGRRPWDVATCTAASIGIATDSPASRLPRRLLRRGYLQQSRLTRAGYPTPVLWNARSHTDAHGHGCPSARAMQHSGGAEATVAFHR